MIRLLIYLFLIYFIVNLFKALLSPKISDEEKRSDVGEEMVEDRSCGTFIPKSTAFVKRVKGERLYFCSKECWENYKETG